MKTGFKDLDNVMCIERGDVVVVGGSTAMGVSSLLRQISFHNVKNGVQVDFLDLQNTPTDHLIRVLSQECEIERSVLLKEPLGNTVSILKSIQEQQKRDVESGEGNCLSGEQFQALLAKLIYIQNRKNYRIGNLDCMGILEYISEIEKMPEVLVIDPIQFGCFRDDKGAYLSIAMKLLKQKALKDETVVFVGSRLSRNVDNRQGHRPMLSDLAESSSLENVADKVLFILRREHYDPLDKPGLAEIIVPKNNRSVPCISVTLSFRKDISAFSDYSPVINYDSREVDPVTAAADAL